MWEEITRQYENFVQHSPRPMGFGDPIEPTRNTVPVDMTPGGNIEMAAGLGLLAPLAFFNAIIPALYALESTLPTRSETLKVALEWSLEFGLEHHGLFVASTVVGAALYIIGVMKKR